MAPQATAVRGAGEMGQSPLPSSLFFLLPLVATSHATPTPMKPQGPQKGMWAAPFVQDRRWLPAPLPPWCPLFAVGGDLSLSLASTGAPQRSVLSGTTPRW